MKGHSFYLGLATAASLAFAAHAADTDAAGADALVKSLTSVLPEKAAASGFITATPEGDHYKLSADFSKLVRAFVPADAKFNLSAVYDMLVYPADATGLINIKRDTAPLDIKGSWEQGPEKGSFSYFLKDFVFNGQFDPSIYYFRDGTAHASGGTMTVDDGKQKIDASFGPYDQVLTASGATDGATDFNARMSLAGLNETIAGPGAPPASISIGNMSGSVAAKGVRFKEMAAVASMISAHAGEKDLKAEDKKTLLDLTRKAMPLWSALEEEFTLDNLAFSVPGVGVKLEKATYKFGATGLVDNAAIGIGFGFTNPGITGVPQMVAYGDLMPKTFTMRFSVTGINLATALNAMAEQADFSAAEPLTKAQMDAIGKLFLKDGKVTVEVPEFAAVSSLYDISVKGRFLTDVMAQPAKASAEFDVAARNIDNTIKGIQQLAQTIPDLNTASFGLMLAKGMAKNDPDGTAHWKVEVSDTGAVTVNGQVMPH